MNAPVSELPAAGRSVRAGWTRHRERGSTRLLHVMAQLSLRFGRRRTRPLLHLIACYFFLFAPAARRNSLRYLSRALGRPARAADWYRLLLTFGTTIHDRIFLLNDHWQEFSFDIEGEALLEHQQSQGALLLGAHLGSFEAIRAVGRRRPALRIAMAMYPDNARKMAAMLTAIAPDADIDLIALGRADALLQIRDRFEAGALVGMLGDRSVAEEAGHAVDFLGATAHLPLAPLRAAAALRRPVIFMLGLHAGDNRYEIVFEPLADFSAVEAGQRDVAVRAALLRYTQLLEQYCRRYPYNWFNFHDFWRRPAGAGDARV